MFRRDRSMNGRAIQRYVTPALVSAAVVLAIGFGALMSVSPISVIVLSTGIFLGTIFLVLPADYVPVASLVAITGGAVLVPASATTGLFEVGPVSELVLFALFGITLTMLTIARYGLGAAFRSGSTGVLAAAFLLLLVSVSLANQSPDLSRSVALWSLWAAAFILALYVPPRLIRVVLASWIAAAFLEAVYAVYEFLAEPEPLYANYLIEDIFSRSIGVTASGVALFRVQGTFGHPIPLASFLVVGFALALWAPRSSTRKYAEVVRLSMLAVLAVGVVVTFSRSSWIGMFVVVVAGLVYRRTGNRDRLRVIALCSVPAAILFFTPLGSYAFDYTQNIENTLSFRQRAGSLQAVPELLGTGPAPVLIGMGARAKGELYSSGILPSVQNMQVVDNQYITLFIETGLVGLLLFVMMSWSALRAMHHKITTSPSSTLDERTGLGISVAFLGILCIMLFYDGLYWPSTAILFWSMLGFLSRKDTSKSVFDRALRRGRGA